MKIVVIANEAPWPSNHGGRIRMARVLQVLADHHQVFLASPSESNFEYPDFIQSHLRLIKKGSRRSRFSLRPKLGSDLLRKNQQELRAFIDAVQPDAIYWTHSYLPAGAQELYFDYANISFVEFANIEGQRFASMARSQDFKNKVRLTIESLKAKKWEPRVARQAKAAIALSQKDASNLMRWNARVLLAPNGVNYQPIATANLNAYLLIFASMNYAPNAESTLDFVQNMWPDLSRSFPELHLVVAGRSANHLKIAEDIKVTVISDPESQEDIYKGALASVIPTTSGGGSQLKITESLQRNRLSLISPYTLSTAPPELNDYLSPFTYRSSQDLVDLVESLLSVPSRQVQEAKIQSVLSELSWEKMLQPVLDELSTIIK